MIPYRLTPAAVTAIWRRTSLCVHELTGPGDLWSGVTSGTSRTAPPTAGQAGACSTQTRFGPWLVTAIQPHASHTTSINGAPIEGIRASRARSSQSTRLPRARHALPGARQSRSCKARTKRIVRRHSGTLAQGRVLMPGRRESNAGVRGWRREKVEKESWREDRNVVCQVEQMLIAADDVARRDAASAIR